MALAHHDDLTFTAGDDFDIGGALLRPDGSAYDLTNASVVWMLRDPDGLPALQDAAINLTPPLTAGSWSSPLPATETATLRPGRYTDWLRATDSRGHRYPLDWDYRGQPQPMGLMKWGGINSVSWGIIHRIA